MSIDNSMPTILVVDDEESFIEALQVGLRREGFRIEVARDGAEALAVLTRFVQMQCCLMLCCQRFREPMFVVRSVKEFSSDNHGFGKRCRDRCGSWA